MTTEAEARMPQPPTDEPMAAASLAAMVQQLLPKQWQGLRRDLLLHPGANDEWQQPTWTLEDPVSGSLFRLGRSEHDLLLCLLVDNALSGALSRYHQRHKRLPEATQLLAFLTMLQQQQLHITPVDSPETKPPLSQKIKQLMFLRLPLVKPDKVLTKFLPAAKFLASPSMRLLYILVGIIGLLRVIPQWEMFMASGGYLFTPQGALAFFLCLAGTKILHEFAHGFSAKAKGLYVPEMGVMLILLWPILYTNTTQAWKLTSRAERFKIDSAGIRFELSLAALALFGWAFTEPGLLRNLLFFTASAALITTLLVNLNPLMRFDGYYMLMDAWRTDNLQPRALSLAQYKMRRLLWDWQSEQPEHHPHPRRLVVFGMATFIYRLLIGFALAGIVYGLLGAQPGALAFIVVFGLLVLSPIIQEIKTLASQRALLGKPWRVALSIVALTAFILLLAIPLHSRESIPAMVMLIDELEITAALDGQLASELPAVGTNVTAGTTLAVMKNSALAYEHQQARQDTEIQKLRTQALAAQGEQGALRNWLQTDIQRLEQRVATLSASQQQLHIKAPRDAIVLRINEQLTIGDSIARQGYLLTLGQPTLQLQALLRYRDASRLTDDDLDKAEIHFGDAITPPLEAKLMGRRPYETLPRDSLFDTQGGPIATVENNGTTKPRDAYQTLTYRIDEPPPHLTHGQNVQLWITGPQLSVLSRIRNFIVRKLSGDGVI